MNKGTLSAIGLAAIGTVLVLWGAFGLLSVSTGADGANPVLALALVGIGVAVIVGGWLTRNGDSQPDAERN